MLVVIRARGQSAKALLDTGFRHAAVAGGAGANWKLRQVFARSSVRRPSEKAARTGSRKNKRGFSRRSEHRTDNGAMIAFAGATGLQSGHSAGAFNVKPRWPLTEIVKSA